MTLGGWQTLHLFGSCRAPESSSSARFRQRVHPAETLILSNLVERGIDCKASWQKEAWEPNGIPFRRDINGYSFRVAGTLDFGDVSALNCRFKTRT